MRNNTNIYKDSLSLILSDGLALGLVVVDREYRVTVWNEWMAKQSGIKAGDILGKNIFERFPEIKERNKDRYITGCIENGLPYVLSSYFHDHLIPLHIIKGEVTISMLQNIKVYPVLEGEAVSGAAIIIEDVTERILYEKELAAERERLAVTLCSIGDGVIVSDMEEKVVLINKIAEELTGWTQDEGVGQPVNKVFQIINENTREPCENPVEKVMETGLIHGLANHTALIAKDGTEYPIADSGAPIRDKEGHIIGVVLVFRDVTEKLKLDAQLTRAQKMEAVGTLTGGIAHDFNNILGIIIGNTELALDDVPEWNPAHYNLEEIKNASLRAKDVVRQLLSFIRKTEVKRQPLNIIPVIKDSLKFLRSTITANIDIRQNIQDTDDTVVADPIQIHQIMINLCTNAFHAVDEAGGILDIGIQNVVLDEDSAYLIDPELKQGNYVKMTVSDTGSGIAPEIVERIFDPYFTTKEVGKGSGLGLSVVYGIVKFHGGSITVESELGKGTTFSVFFPVTEEKIVTKSKIVEELSTGDERILFIDDEKSIVKVIKKILERLGYKVETKMNPVDALELFRSNPDHFDLVITDMAMPQMTGDKLVREILNIRSEMPIIICTGFSEKVSEDNAKELGIKAFAMKPLVIQDFAMTVRQVLDLNKT